MAELPTNLRELCWSGTNCPTTQTSSDQLTLQGYIASLRRQLGIKPDATRYARKPVSACASTGSGPRQAQR